MDSQRDQVFQELKKNRENQSANRESIKYTTDLESIQNILNTIPQFSVVCSPPSIFCKSIRFVEKGMINFVF